MRIKLNKGDCVDMRGLSVDQRKIIIDYFIECGATHSWTEYPYELVRHDIVFRSKVSGEIDGYRHFKILGGYTMFDGMNLLAKLRSQDDTSKDLTMEEMMEKHKEIREVSERVLSVSRNVVFVDYETNHLQGAMEITITDNKEVTVCIGKMCVYDNVESKKNIEETVDMMKVWRSIIDSAIKEMEE